MSSFFTVPASQRKRKRTETRVSRPAKKRGVDRDGDDAETAGGTTRRRQERDDSISGSDSEDGLSDEGSIASSASSEEEGETAAEKRLRLAQRYLDNIKEGIDEAGFDAADVDRDLIAQRLRQDADEAKGRQYRQISSRLDLATASRTPFRADTQSTTGVALRAPYLYTVSKDKTLVKWELATPPVTNSSDQLANGTRPQRRKPKQLQFVRGVKIYASASQQHGHSGSILAVAASPDGKYVVTGGMDRKMIIWTADTLKPLKTFHAHRDSVTSLSFAPTPSQLGVGSQLFSTSLDRTLKTFSLNGDDSLAYVETLFGHQDHVLSVAALAQDQCVSVGARDRTARLWKVVDETQLVFRGDSSKKDPYTVGSIECVAAMPPTHFVTGSDAGSISLWSMHKKKPLFTIYTAHGVDEPEPLENVTSESDPKVIEDLKQHDYRKPVARGITSLASIPNTDLFLSGSWDGCLRFWRTSSDKRTIEPLGYLGSPASSISPASSQSQPNGTNGTTSSTTSSEPQSPAQPIYGFINCISLHERRAQILNEFGGKKDGETTGICVVIGVGKEQRLGRWKVIKEAKNGCVVFEVPILT